MDADKAKADLLRIRTLVRLFQDVNLKFRDEFIRVGGLVDVHPDKLQKLVIGAVTMLSCIVHEMTDPLGIVFGGTPVEPGKIQTLRQSLRSVIGDQEHSFVISMMSLPQKRRQEAENRSSCSQ